MLKSQKNAILCIYQCIHSWLLRRNLIRKPIFSHWFLPKGGISPLPLVRQPLAQPLWALCSFGRLPSAFLYERGSQFFTLPLSLSPPLPFHCSVYLWTHGAWRLSTKKANVDDAVIQSGALKARGGGGVLVNERAWQPVKETEYQIFIDARDCREKRRLLSERPREPCEQ